MMICALSLYLAYKSLMAAHDRLKGGQVNEPKTIITGFSLRSSDKVKGFPSVFLNVKSTAASPWGKPEFWKSPCFPSSLQPLLSASDMIGVWGRWMAESGTGSRFGDDVGVAIVGTVVTQPTTNTTPATSVKQVRSFLSMASSSLDFRMELSRTL